MAVSPEILRAVDADMLDTGIDVLQGFLEACRDGARDTHYDDEADKAKAEDWYVNAFRTLDELRMRVYEREAARDMLSAVGLAATTAIGALRELVVANASKFTPEDLLPATVKLEEAARVLASARELLEGDNDWSTTGHHVDFDDGVVRYEVSQAQSVKDETTSLTEEVIIARRGTVNLILDSRNIPSALRANPPVKVTKAEFDDDGRLAAGTAVAADGTELFVIRRVTPEQVASIADFATAVPGSVTVH